jgi:uncharacterized membrane protein YraQ (UPF0718 family)
MDWLAISLYHAAAMLWEMLWALVLGFAISATLQVFVSKQAMVNAFGKNGLKEVALAMAFGAASSSCSYAAAATTKTVFKKGAAFVPSLAFMIASTNLVVELGIVLWILMGWRFVLAEIIGAFVMVAAIWVLFAIHRPEKLISEARKFSESKDAGHHHESGGKKSKIVQVAEAFFMDWSMLWKEIVIGVFVAGFLMTLVPKSWWQSVFISHGPYAGRLIENAVVGPLIAMASFVCSVGNIPLASLLWSSGATFGGVIAFLYGDLIVLPLVLAYRKYYGIQFAIYITVALFAAMVSAGILVDLLFSATGLAPQNSEEMSAISQAGFSWDYTTWLNLVALAGGGWLFYLHFTNRENEESHQGTRGKGHHAHHAH